MGTGLDWISGSSFWLFELLEAGLGYPEFVAAMKRIGDRQNELRYRLKNP